VPHHLIDVADAWESFSAARWCELAASALADLAGRERLPIVSGGTILYLKALLYGLFDGPARDAEVRQRLEAQAAAQGVVALHERLRRVDAQAAERIHPNDLRRIVRALEVYEISGRPISELQRQFGRAQPHLAPLVVAIRRTREDLHRRIDERVERMMAAGFEDEVRRLAALPQGLSPEATQAVGYREMIDCLEGRLSRAQAVALIRKNTRTFARRQMTHLRSLKERLWLDVAPHEEPAATAARVIDLWERRAV
jgi:tRNA dimethylallyltransferase